MDLVDQKWDVVVIGGGIIGLSSAWALAHQGLKVALLEKGSVGAEQSSRNWGWIRTLHRDLAEVPLALRASPLWENLQSRIDVGYRRTGLAYLAVSEKEMANHESWLKAARHAGVKASLLGREETRRLTPGGNRNWTGALFSDSDGVAEPTLVPNAVARLASAAGVQIFENCAVRGFDTEAGKISGVWTERGRVRADAVVCAGGVWSRLLCGNFGIDVPQLKVSATAFETSPVVNGPGVALNGGDFVCRPHVNGGYLVSQLGASKVDLVPDSFRLFFKFLPAWRRERKLLQIRVNQRFFKESRVPRKFAMDEKSPFENMRIYDAEATNGTVAHALNSLTQAFPQFKDAKVTRQWGGYIDVTPDALPIISEIASTPGLYMATGFSGHGFGIGMAAGQMMANIISSKNRLPEEEAKFSFNRFSK